MTQSELDKLFFEAKTPDVFEQKVLGLGGKIIESDFRPASTMTEAFVKVMREFGLTVLRDPSYPIAVTHGWVVFPKSAAKPISQPMTDKRPPRIPKARHKK